MVETNTRNFFQQTLVIEPDIQLLIDVVYQTASMLNGSLFVLTKHLPIALTQLRCEWGQPHKPLSVFLYVHESQLCITWQGKKLVLLDLGYIPSDSSLSNIKQQLEDTMQEVDPQALLQHNHAIKLHFEQERHRLETAFFQLQQSLQARQKELEEAVVRAETDGLTGLLNRRSFDIRVKQAFLHTMRQRHSPLSLIFFDLDYFKEVNDTYGHQFGDDYLNKMSKALREIIRENVDMAFRFGGDEFAVLIFADYEPATEKAKQVLLAMNNKVSIGIACIDFETPADLTVEQFIFQADQALYEAKRNGRGQIMLAPQL